MTIRFRAVDVHIENTEAHALLGLSSGGTEPEHHVIMMRALSDAPGVVDALTGDAYFEYRDEHHGGYGCVSRALLKPNLLQLTCDKRRCPALPDSDFEVELADAVAARFEEIAGALEALIDGPRVVIERP